MEGHWAVMCGVQIAKGCVSQTHLPCSSTLFLGGDIIANSFGLGFCFLAFFFVGWLVFLINKMAQNLLEKVSDRLQGLVCLRSSPNTGLSFGLSE